MKKQLYVYTYYRIQPFKIKNSIFAIVKSDLSQVASLKDIPAQWAKIRQGLDIFRISSKCVCLSNGEV